MVFDIGGSSTKWSIIDEVGEFNESGKFSCPNTAEEFFSELIKITNEMKVKYDVKGIAISAPGAVDGETGLIGGVTAIPYIHGPNFKEILKEGTGLNAELENDANCAAIAEQWLGNAQGIENYIVVVLGTAVGCGIIINGKVYQGAHGAAGEIGWSMQGPLDYTHDLEDDSWNFTSGVILGLYNRYYQATGQKISDARLILDLVRQGDVLATKVVDQYYEDVAKGLLNLICVFDPEVLLLGGGISANQEFLDKLTDRIEKIKRHHRSMNQLKNDTIADIKPCFLRNDAGLIGAVYQAKQMK